MRALALVSACLVLQGALAGCVRHVVPPGLQNAAVTEEVPPGMVVVDVVSANEAMAWDVYVDRGVACTTPCRQWFRPEQRLVLKARRGGRLEVHGLGAEAAAAQHAVLVAEPRSRAKEANGIVFTTLGGMGAVVGITLTAAGCSNVEKRRGVCTAGLITSGVSLPVMAAFIWMLADSGPKAHVLPVPPGVSKGRRGELELQVTPNGVAGKF